MVYGFTIGFIIKINVSLIQKRIYSPNDINNFRYLTETTKITESLDWSDSNDSNHSNYQKIPPLGQQVIKW